MNIIPKKHAQAVERQGSTQVRVERGVEMKIGRKNTTALFLAGAVFLWLGSVWKNGDERCVCDAETAQNTPYGWDKTSSYTTYYNAKDEGRCENITIAAELIDGATVQPYGEFSFNKTVGRRTAEAGFRQAKIIVNGEYVLGVGGGVCQVSTTLYNAALKSGLEVLEYHPHSLQIPYVAPSRDAMVSSECDLQLYNAHAYPVCLTAEVFSGGLRVSVYGRNEGDRYEMISRTIEEIPPPAPIVKMGEKEEIIRSPKNGVRSELYLERYRGNVLLSRKRIRVDEYRPTQGIIAKKVVETTNKMVFNACLFQEKLL